LSLQESDPSKKYALTLWENGIVQIAKEDYDSTKEVIMSAALKYANSVN
jgi:hypothetical protein